MGLVSHYWYIWLDNRIASSTIQAVMKKVVLDLAVSPIMWIGGFAILGFLENSGWEKFTQRSFINAKKLYIAEWLVWTPFQALNFYYLPTNFRVLYVGLISLGFDWYSSYMLYDEYDYDDDKDSNNCDEKNDKKSIRDC